MPKPRPTPARRSRGLSPPTVTLTVRLTADQHARLSAAAKHEGLTLASVVRGLLDALDGFR